MAEKERLKRLCEEKERLLRQDVLLSLENEGDDLVLRVVEDEMPKLDSYGPETYKEFREYCKREGLSSSEALRKLGISASKLLNTFDSWYDAWNELDGKSGIECLIWEVWSEVNAALPRLDTQKTHAREESVKASLMNHQKRFS